MTVYTHKFCKGTDKGKARSSGYRGTDKDRLHVVFSRPELIEPVIRNLTPALCLLTLQTVTWNSHGLASFRCCCRHCCAEHRGTSPFDLH